MSVTVMGLVWEHSRHKGGDLLVLLALADHADDFGISYPSIDHLAQKTRMSRRNTIYVIRRLEKSRELHVYNNAGPAGVHKYLINIILYKKKGGANIAHVQKQGGVQNPDPKLHPNHQGIEEGEEEEEGAPPAPYSSSSFHSGSVRAQDESSSLAGLGQPPTHLSPSELSEEEQDRRKREKAERDAEDRKRNRVYPDCTTDRDKLSKCIHCGALMTESGICIARCQGELATIYDEEEPDGQ